MIEVDTLWNALPLPALVVDAEDRIAQANGPMELFANRSAKALLGADVVKLLRPEGGLDAPLARARRAGTPLTLHDTMLYANGGPAKRADLYFTPVGEEAVLILVAPQTIVDRLERQRSTRSAARSAIGMAEMLAHEIKNPLAGITGAAQLLSMNLEAEDRELTDLIVTESRRIVKLLEQVEQFGNVSPPQRRAVNLHDVLDRARRSAMVGFAAHMTIKEQYDPSLPHAWADSDQLLQVVLNLLRNAAQAGKQGGTITLRTFYEGGMRTRKDDGSGRPVPLQIEIVDDGPGIPPDITRTLWQPFVSGRENGTGLGLALVAKIVADHDGWIGVDSEPGRTAFRVSLPMALVKAKQ
ncbi:two-component system sensor histidine kinase NtrB [Jannaschia aquimarina]|uniref:histidine kinase n=1 Tax=Jannaschia aquimarina TaxID=935700 RepID=A0A0D1EMI2_9RHOB|nr:ATP-binding protein [Jannaschia aquimarina]KIT18191.1 Nitrogen regulation protein NR(II) [Jannaschia aquimarina]SNT40232.1 two-component system, NtrC family, nitrogen regulation sensor histidine kinase GlnL [Jannaschia aquimarina]